MPSELSTRNVNTERNALNRSGISSDLSAAQRKYPLASRHPRLPPPCPSVATRHAVDPINRNPSSLDHATSSSLNRESYLGFLRANSISTTVPACSGDTSQPILLIPPEVDCCYAGRNRMCLQWNVANVANVWLQVADLLVSVVQNVANPSNATNACRLQNARPLGRIKLMMLSVALELKSKIYSCTIPSLERST